MAGSFESAMFAYIKTEGLKRKMEGPFSKKEGLNFFS